YGDDPSIEQDDARGYAKKCARCLRYMHIQGVLLSKYDLFNKASIFLFSISDVLHFIIGKFPPTQHQLSHSTHL
ncbi:MAG: hypothetical protein WAU54_21805, partial [Chania sp.]